MQTTIKQHYIPRFYMKNFYIKNSKKFDVLDKFNNYTPISQNKTENSKELFYIENLYEILYLIFDYPHKHYTFKYFEV